MRNHHFTDYASTVTSDCSLNVCVRVISPECTYFSPLMKSVHHPDSRTFLRHDALSLVSNVDICELPESEILQIAFEG